MSRVIEGTGGWGSGSTETKHSHEGCEVAPLGEESPREGTVER